MKNNIFIAILIFSAFVVQSCATAHILSNLNLSEEKDSSLLQSSYPAADMLSQYIEAHIGKYKDIHVETLSYNGHEDIEVPLGVIISDQISNRLSQLGYNIIERPKANVRLEKVIEEADINIEEEKGFFSSFFVEKKEAPEYIPYINKVKKGIVLTGSYDDTRTNVIISTKIVNRNNNNIIAAYEYTISKNKDVRDLLIVPGDDKGMLEVFY